MQLAAALLGLASTLAAVERPAFVTAAVVDAGMSEVSDILETDSGDFIILRNGLNAGYQRGQVLEVIRGNQYVGSIVLIAVEEVAAAAMIRDLAPNATIQLGDRTRYSRI